MKTKEIIDKITDKLRGIPTQLLISQLLMIPLITKLSSKLMLRHSPFKHANDLILIFMKLKKK